MDASYPIDIRLKGCYAKGQSTHGEAECARKAEAEWDAELNRAYRKLLGTLGAEGKPGLVKAQRAWISYRDAEFALTVAVYDSREGSMFIPIQAHARMRVVRARALELAHYATRNDSR